MKPIAQVAVIVLSIPGGLMLAMRVAGLDKMRRAGMAFGKKVVGDPIMNGARAAQGYVANKGSQSKSRSFRGLARVVTGTVRPGGARRMAAQGAAYSEDRKKMDEAYRNAVLNRKGASNAPMGSRRADDIVAGLQGMKMEDVPSLKPGTITALLGHNDDRVVQAALDLFNRASKNSSVQSRLTGDQLRAIETAPGFGMTPVVVPAVASPGPQIPTRAPGRARKVGRTILRQFGRRPGWPNQP